MMIILAAVVGGLALLLGFSFLCYRFVINISQTIIRLQRDRYVEYFKTILPLFAFTFVITLWRVHVTSLTASMSAVHFCIEIMFILKVTKSHFKGSYDKQNLTLVVILYEIYEIRQRLVPSISYKMTTRVSAG